MHREPLLHMLERYAAANPEEARCARRIESLVREREDCFERSCLPGHITASAWIVSPDHRECLLTHHRKLDRWLQLGGHADGDPDVLAVALREAREESGMQDFSHLIFEGTAAGTLESLADPSPRERIPMPLDIDVHSIPARGDEPQHEHHDIRYLLVAGPGQSLAISDESHDLAWVTWDRLDTVGGDESLLRMARKARPRFAAPACAAASR